MTSFSDVDKKTYFYKLAIKDRESLNILNDRLKNLNGIKNIEIRYFENHI